MKLPRSAVWGIPGSQHCKAAIELLRSAVWQRDHRTAEVCSLSPRKKVWIELPALAVLVALSRTALYGRCSQVCMSGNHIMKMSESVWLCLPWQSTGLDDLDSRVAPWPGGHLVHLLASCGHPCWSELLLTEWLNQTIETLEALFYYIYLILVHITYIWVWWHTFINMLCTYISLGNTCHIEQF